MAPDKIYVKEFNEGISQMWSSTKAADWTTAIAQHEYIRKDVLLDKLKFALKLRDDGNPNSNDDGVQTIKAMINYIESL